MQQQKTIMQTWSSGNKVSPCRSRWNPNRLFGVLLSMTQMFYNTLDRKILWCCWSTHATSKAGLSVLGEGQTSRPLLWVFQRLLTFVFHRKSCFSRAGFPPSTRRSDYRGCCTFYRSRSPLRLWFVILGFINKIGSNWRTCWLSCSGSSC